jgi:hypothetical protein
MQEKRPRPTWRQLLLLLTRRCPHWRLSAPLTLNNETFRACVACGARRRFNLNTWLEEGGFYYPADNERETTSGHTDISE